MKQAERKKIGDFMIEKGLILREWVDEIIDYSKKKGVRFGEAAVALGYITEAELRQVLLAPYGEESFFRLNPLYFPKVTRDLLSIEGMLEYGALPLGYKSEWSWFRSMKRLNLGLVSPKRKDSLEWVRSQAPGVQSFKIFQVLPDEYLAVLQQIYGVSRERIAAFPKLDESIGLYLQLERRRPRRTGEAGGKG